MIKAQHISLVALAGLIIVPAIILFRDGLNSRAAPPVAEAANSTEEQSESATSPAEKQWFISNSSFTRCKETDSPAEKIKLLREGGGSEPSTKDVRAADGTLVSVEVSISEGNEDRYWTYFTTEDSCVASLPANKSIPNEYR